VPHSLIVGASGSGKTTLARALLAGAPRRIVIDPTPEAQYSGEPVASLAALQARVAALWGHAFALTWRPPSVMRPEALHHVASFLIEMSQARPSRWPTVLAVDELRFFFPVEHLPATCRGFNDLCAFGRNHKLHALGITQRVSQVHHDFTGNVENLYVFRPASPVDLDRAVQLIGREWRGRLEGLPNFRYLRRDGATGKVVETALIASRVQGATRGAGRGRKRRA
jgi:hypothetical protein